MCRFLAYLGPPILLSHLITEPENSLIHQSFSSEEREEPLNGDGFGVGWYVPELSPEPALFRSVSPAWSDQNLKHVARVIQSPCLMAHIRAASDASTVAVMNCHPFSSGIYSFMHNGDVAQFNTFRRQLINKLSQAAYNLIEGKTDSEYLFAYFMDKIDDFSKIEDPGEKLVLALKQTVIDTKRIMEEEFAVQEPSYLNIAISDGTYTVACRYCTQRDFAAESLHVHAGKRYHFEDGIAAFVHPEDEGMKSVIISSEALTHDGSWQIVPNGSLVKAHLSGSIDFSLLESANF